MLDAEDMGQVMAHSMTHPKYLHSNSTSHVWAFGAIAELADNALDAGATKFSMDLVTTPQLLAHVKSEPGASRRAPRSPTGPFVMTFQDNGKGMSPIELHKMLSFGHCDKDKVVSEVNGQAMPIGHYGNGFKSGSMRLGKDALVFTKCARTQSVGLLSQTFLAETHATEVLVPIVSWDNETGEPISVRFARQILSTTPISANQQLTEAFNANLKVITKFSPFGSATALRLALNKIQGTGTHIVVFNLRKPAESDEPCEFSLEDNSESKTLSHDIQLARCMWDEVTVAAGHSLSPINFSLREYMSILYLNPRMQIWIRGHNVQLRKLHYCLYKPRQYFYRPKSAEGEPVAVTMGFNMFSEKEHFGMMLYHRDRLIKYFLHVGYQLSPDSRGVGVIGVLNVNALQPTHNKQSFIMDNNYRLLVNNLKDQLARYWKAVIGNSTLTVFWNHLARAKESGKMCVQCSKCMKWRIVLERGDIPELWDCSMRSGFSCDDPETLPPIPPLSKPGPQPLTDVERKLEEQVVKIEKRHKDTLTKLRAVKARELATVTGFPVDKCVAALRVSSDNKDLAAELLVSNKPIRGFDIEMDEEDEEQFTAPLRRSQRQANALARAREATSDAEVHEGEEEEEDAARENDEDDEDDENSGSSRKRKRRESSASSSSSKKSKQKKKKKQKKKQKKRQKRTSASHELEEVENGEPEQEDGMTERERRRRERELQKQLMLEERLLGRDSSTSLARAKGKEVQEVEDDEEEEENMEEGEEEEEEDEDEAPLRRRNKKKSRRTSRGRGDNSDDDGYEGREEEDDEEQEDGHNADSDDSGTGVRPFGSSGDRCDRCEDMERELKRQEGNVESLQRRVRELEEQLQRALSTNNSTTTAPTPVANGTITTTLVKVKKEPNTTTTTTTASSGSSTTTTAAAATEEERLPIFGAGTESRPYVLAAVKNEPDPYEFIEFI